MKLKPAASGSPEVEFMQPLWEKYGPLCSCSMPIWKKDCGASRDKMHLHGGLDGSHILSSGENNRRSWKKNRMQKSLRTSVRTQNVSLNTICGSLSHCVTHLVAWIPRLGRWKVREVTRTRFSDIPQLLRIVNLVVALLTCEESMSLVARISSATSRVNFIFCFLKHNFLWACTLNVRYTSHYFL